MTANLTGRRALGLLLGLAVLVWTAVPADAESKRQRPRGNKTITVESNYTSDRVTGAVRHGPGGPQVQLPGGAWVPCHFGCAHTLRTQSIDFWFWIGENSRD